MSKRKRSPSPRVPDIEEDEAPSSPLVPPIPTSLMGQVEAGIAALPPPPPQQHLAPPLLLSVGASVAQRLRNQARVLPFSVSPPSPLSLNSLSPNSLLPPPPPPAPTNTPASPAAPAPPSRAAAQAGTTMMMDFSSDDDTPPPAGTPMGRGEMDDYKFVG